MPKPRSLAAYKNSILSVFCCSLKKYLGTGIAPFIVSRLRNGAVLTITQPATSVTQHFTAFISITASPAAGA